MEREISTRTEELADVGSLGTTRLVEELEHLEEEAITGDDEGRDPTDYNRRAHIFDKSSQVFQANKDHDTRSNSDRSI